MNAVQQGVLVIADIGGYTRYLGGVELEHSHDILADLIGVVTERLGASLRVAKLEGDAVFCAGSDAELLEHLRKCYEEFTRRQRTIALNSTCACDACRRITELELKFVAHHGSFVQHEVAGSTELVGRDVIVVHRMLKNSVQERLGVSAYALLSDACVASLRCQRAGMAEHSEHYGDIGELRGLVLDLREAQGSQPAVRLAEGDAEIVLSAEVPASAARTWAALTDANEQLRWRVGVTRIDVDGEPGLGAETHCVHGKTTFKQVIVDWRPSRYYSFTERTPIGTCLWTVELEDRGAGHTRVIWRIALAGGRGQAVMYALFGRRLRQALEANMNAFQEYLARGS